MDSGSEIPLDLAGNLFSDASILDCLVGLLIGLSFSSVTSLLYSASCLTTFNFSSSEGGMVSPSKIERKPPSADGLSFRRARPAL